MKQKKIIIVGATSTIGTELAGIFFRQHHALGLTGRNTEKLDALSSRFPESICEQLDVTQPDCKDKINILIQKLGGVDVAIICPGARFVDATNKNEGEMIAVNVEGFVNVFQTFEQYFLSQNSGHIVGISSIAALRGGYASPAYNASKAFISSYMEGKRKAFRKSGKSVYVTDIQLGYVKTPMTKHEKLASFAATPEKVAKQIVSAIEHKRGRTVITKRWRLLAILLKYMPDFIFKRL